MSDNDKPIKPGKEEMYDNSPQNNENDENETKNNDDDNDNDNLNRKQPSDDDRSKFIYDTPDRTNENDTSRHKQQTNAPKQSKVKNTNAAKQTQKVKNDNIQQVQPDDSGFTPWSIFKIKAPHPHRAGKIVPETFVLPRELDWDELAELTDEQMKQLPKGPCHKCKNINVTKYRQEAEKMSRNLQTWIDNVSKLYYFIKTY